MGGRNKALLPLRGHSFLSQVAKTCQRLSISELVVVLAEPYEEENRRAAAELGLPWVCNPDPGRGMASSVALGFAYSLENFRASSCWLWPVDLPAVSAKTLEIVSAQQHLGEIVIPTFSGRGGHPTLVRRDLWHPLACCSDEPEGARSVFRRPGRLVVRVPVSDSAVRMDVDTPLDLMRLL